MPASAFLRLPRLLLAAAAALVCLLALYLVLLPGGKVLEILGNDIAYEASIALVAAVCVLRGLREAGLRSPWVLLGVGVALWNAGDVFWTVAYTNVAKPPFPSPADAGYLAFYGCAYVALLRFSRGHGARGRGSTWLDGLVTAASVAAVALALVVTPVLTTLGGDVIANATNLAYPLADALLIALVLAGVATARVGVGLMWGGLAAGLLVLAAADSVYVAQVARDTYDDTSILTLGWPVGMLLLGFAAVQPTTRPDAEEQEEHHRLLALPVSCGLVSLGLLLWDHFHRLSSAALVLAALSVLAMAARLGLTYAENVRMLRHIREDALTDQLTGLGNRRRFVGHLDRALASATPHLLLLFDLNGFKGYNDSFGHMAGDALLAQLGGRLNAAVEGTGQAYRMGGDEFCVLLPAEAACADLLVAADAALRAEGEHFEVSAARGCVVIPREATSPSEALRLADSRMYANKHGARGSAGRQAADALVRAIQERNPELDDHVRGVTGLARTVALELGLDGMDLDDVIYAAELHDIGKIAIPDSVLGKPEPLDGVEWEMMHRHTIIGERIVGAAPALRRVAKLVRWSHERWDGEGYPDRLLGEQIPLGARIVSVCDAYEAMRGGRPYRASRRRAEAVTELERCAGTQFDPAVVAAAIRCADRATAKERAAEPEPDSALV